jgi:hypothetical protein
MEKNLYTSQDDDDSDSDMKMPAKESANSDTAGHKNETTDSITTEESDSASMVEVTCQALTPARTVGTEVSSAGSLSQPIVDIDLRREQLYHQTVVLSIATVVSIGVVILAIIPIYVVAALAAFAASGGLLSYVAFNRLLLEYQEIVAGDGLLQFLPASLVQNLTQLSLHQFMRDDTFVRE